MIKVKSHLLIWDSPKKHTLKKIDNITILFWQRFDNEKNKISIPNLVEENSDFLRLKYLEWIYKIGNTKVNSKTIIELLKVRDNFSAWWMSLISEKSNFAKSDYIDEIIKLILLDELEVPNLTLLFKVVIPFKVVSLLTVIELVVKLFEDVKIDKMHRIHEQFRHRLFMEQKGREIMEEFNIPHHLLN